MIYLNAAVVFFLFVYLVVTGAVVFFLFVLLVVALIRPEWFKKSRI